MTYQEIFIQILSEVSGKSKKELNDLLNTFRQIHPGGKWDKALSEKEANELLASLRREKAGILRWLHEGAAEVARHETNTTH